MRDTYERRMTEIRHAFERDGDGLTAVSARAAVVDGMIGELWLRETRADDALKESQVSKGPNASKGARAFSDLGSRVTLAAVGGYGRGELFPESDIDLLFCVAKGEAPKTAIRSITQVLWDCGLRVSPITRLLGDCERLEPENVEFALALLDRRWLAGDSALYARLDTKAAAKMLAKDCKALRQALLELTTERHRRYGDTLFHLEPNLKECPGGLRDVNVCGWLRKLSSKADATAESPEFAEARRFLTSTRCFLHWRAGRDDNTLDWATQDAAATAGVGLGGRRNADAASWMRSYFRHARVVVRQLEHGLERSVVKPQKLKKKPALAKGVVLLQGRLCLAAQLDDGRDPAGEPEAVLALFRAMAESGASLAAETESRIGDAIPQLAAHLEEGPGLWRALEAVLLGSSAGLALRTMHAIGVLDLVLPEFHGIDALVVRDAYHRYTVDEHTFVLIDVLHGLEATPDDAAQEPVPEWRLKLGQMLRELRWPGLLYLAALMHDTGKARSGEAHATASAELARTVMARWEMEPFDEAQVLGLIEMHLEMSAALRRDIFDAPTVRAFAGKVQTHEMLRMLTLFTYADIQAVHPDALTPWKAENLWRLSMNAANQMDRAVDEERVRTGGGLRQMDERIAKVLERVPGRQEALRTFLEGFPERYLSTRSTDQIVEQFHMAERFGEEPLQLALHHGASTSEITLVTRDRERLFSTMAGALVAWGMNVLTADAFANGAGLVVDTFRFTDTFHTLELNVEERARFVASVREMVAGRESVEKRLAGRRRGRRKAPKIDVQTRVEFDHGSVGHSSLLQVVAQDVPGLLRAVSQTLSEFGANVEVALVDTEGEIAIDVFYVTRRGARLDAEEETELKMKLIEAIDANAA
jgi:[protein-PII] uridylyltransferase